jgi:hypothetical protein
MVAALRVEIRQAPSVHSVQVWQPSALHSAHSTQDGGSEVVALSSGGNSPLCAQLRRMDLHLFLLNLVMDLFIYIFFC